jgi:crotonobetainyl-CoA:carnitine CoA-transferase CaiB-like acyl-CoA transferase
MAAAPLPLSGIRVVDLTDEFGPLCGRVLGDLGADVVRVEPPEGASSRQLPPFAPNGTSLWFAYRNANKRDVTADLDTDEGRVRLLELLAGADVLVESFAPGRLASLGLDPVELSARFPDLVVCSITPFGQTGPYAHYAATDDVVVALSGWLATSGIPRKPPLLVPGSLASDSVAVHALFAVLAALVQREGNGAGQHLDVSALEAVTQLNTWGIPNQSAIVNAGMAKPIVRSGDSPLYPLIRTKDGMIRLVMLAARQWKALWHWMGEPEAFADPMWEQTVVRLQNLDILNPMFEEFFSDKNMEEAAAEAQRRGLVATPMLKPGDVLRNEHFLSRGTFVDCELAPGVRGPVAAGFFELDGERLGVHAPCPTIGEDDDELLGANGSTPAADATRATAVAGTSSPPPALAGLRVLDFGHGGVGVEGGRMLAEYGADVIKIETSTYPDFMRIVLGGNMTPSFASSSRTKRSFGVNVKNPDGLRILHELVKHADIVIENNSTGTMDEMGVGYATLHELNPNLVMVSSQLVGSRGACATWIGYGPTIQPFGGMTYLWAFPDGEGPPGNPAIHPDHLAGRLCAIGGLAGLFGRSRRGGGGHVEIAQVEAVICLIGDLLLKEALAPGSVQPDGNDDERGAPWGVFRCAGDEQWAVVCVRDDRDWDGLVRAMGNPEGHERFAKAADRLAAREAVNAFVEEWTRTLEPRAVMTRAQAEGVPAGAMLSTLDQLHDPHLEARGFLVPVDQQDSGALVFDGPAFQATGMAPALIRQAPRLGEHTRAVCRDVLGLDDAEIDRLIAAGALEEPSAS